MSSTRSPEARGTQGRTALTGLLLCGLAFASHAAAPHSLAELFAEQQVKDGDLSPNGRRLALALAQADGKSDEISILELGEDGRVASRSRYGLPESGGLRSVVESVYWANDDRLIMSVIIDASKSAGSTPGIFGVRRIHAMNADGSAYVSMFEKNRNVTSRVFDLGQIADYSRLSRGRILVPALLQNRMTLFDVNIMTGEAIAIERGDSGTLGWEANDGVALVRYDLSFTGRVITISGRANASANWKKLARIPINDVRPEWEYAGDAPGAGQIYVRARAPGEDKAAIHEFDLTTQQYGQTVAAVADYDMDSIVSLRQRKIGARYWADTLRYRFDDANLQKHYDGIVKYFGNGANVSLVSTDATASRWLLRVTGPIVPYDFYLYDVARKDLQFLVSSLPGLDPERLAPTQSMRVRARDGLELSAYVTRLRNSPKGAPLVVVPHGGPEKRDNFDFDILAQALAGQGWTVVQVNFRGSSGYGRRFAEAGHGQWAWKMQDDLADVVQELVRSGDVDASRVALFGGSYGGYAALASLFRYPNLYRGAVSWNGVSDLAEMLKYERREEGSDSEAYEYWVKQIGDPRDEKALREASPRHQVVSIQAPVLLVAGLRDQTVPPEQSKLMERALRERGAKVELMEVADEGHSGWKTKNSIRLLDRAIAFLQPLLGAAASPAPVVQD